MFSNDWEYRFIKTGRKARIRKFSVAHVTRMTTSASEVKAGEKEQEEGNNLSGLIQSGAQWHYGVIQISARLGPN